MIKGKIKIVNPETGEVKTQPMRSFNAAFLSYLSKCFGFGYHLDDSPWSADPFVSGFTVAASASDSWGITVGSGSAPLSCSSYSLSNALDFTPSDQPIFKMDCDFGDASSTITFSRTFTNHTGSSASVREIGVVAQYGHHSGVYLSYSNIMFIRDLLDTPETVQAGNSITVEYDLEFGGELSYNFARLIANTVQSASRIAVKTIEGASEYDYILEKDDGDFIISASDPDVGIIIGAYNKDESYTLSGLYHDNWKWFENCLVNFEVNNASKFTRFYISREFKNNAYASLNVKSVGLIVPGDPNWGGTPNVMLYKKLISDDQAITVAHEEFLQIQIEFKTEM